MTSAVGGIRLLASVYGPCSRLRYHEYPTHKVTKIRSQAAASGPSVTVTVTLGVQVCDRKRDRDDSDLRLSDSVRRVRVSQPRRDRDRHGDRNNFQSCNRYCSNKHAHSARDTLNSKLAP